MTNSKEVQIVMARTKEDCEICDKFLSKLITYESSFDSIINKNVDVKGPTENNIKQDDVFVAYAKTDTPLGYVFGYRQFSKGKIYNKDILILEAIYVDESFRGQGVGKLLLESFESWAKEKYEDFVIEITHIHSNENARKFYEQMGYTTSKITLRK